MLYRFMSGRGVSEEESLRFHRPVPGQKLLGKFLDYFVQRPRRANSDPANGNTLSIVGVKSFYGSFAAAYQRITGTHFDRADSAVIRKVRIEKTCAKAPRLIRLLHSIFAKVCLGSSG